MAQIHLSIVTPQGCPFDGSADRVLVRTTGGDVSILPRHIDYAAAMGNGRARITVDGKPRDAHISGGIIYVSKDVVSILTNDFSWKDASEQDAE